MERDLIAKFSVQIFSANNATWQGVVTVDNDSYEFLSELQLIKWLVQKFPELKVREDL